MRPTKADHGLEILLGDALRAFPEIRVGILFGSAAAGRLTRGSDVDIGVAADAALPLERRLEIATARGKAIGGEIDLVDMQGVSGLILQQILAKGVMLLKGAECYATLLKRMLFEQADMMPYTERVRRAHVERFLHG